MIALIWQNNWSALGCRLAGQLVAAGYEVSVFVRNGRQGSLKGNVKPSSKGSVKSGAKDAIGLPPEVIEAKSQISAIKKAEVVLTLLNTPQEVEDVYLGNDGILEHARQSSLFIDLSTSNPRLAKELYALAAVHDHSFVEAPIEGNPDMLETGDFRVYAAGEPDNIKRALPILHALTPHVLEVGLPGNGSSLKLASQIALANTLMGVVEAVTFLQIAGMESNQILRALDTSPTASVVAQAFGKKIIDEEFYYGVDLQQLFFDLTAALDAADEFGLALPGLETAHQLYDLLVLVGGAKKGIHALALIYYDEERCVKHGLNWELAQQAMDVYERANEGAYDDYDYDDDDCDDCDDPSCGHHSHHHYDEGPPTMNGFFSTN